MKKIVSFMLILTMIFSIAVVNSSAAVGVVVDADFSDMERFTANFHAGAFYVEDNVLFGYSEAKCLQSKSEWYVYDTCIDVIFADDDLSDGARSFGMWYCNINLESYGRYDGTNYMVFNYDIENQYFNLACGDLEGGSEPVVLAGPVEYTIEDDEEYTFGLSITRGRIRGFINDQLVIDYVDTEDKYLIGLEDEDTSPTPLVYWNEGNFIQITDVKIASAEYLYPPMPVNDGTTATDTTATEATTTRETTTAISVVEKTDEAGNTMTDDSGNKITETVIITEPPVADTNTGAVQGGNSTNTGDMTFIVVATMVAAIGCALIVRKVSVK